MLSLRPFAGAPGFPSSTFVRELVLEASHGSAVSILVKLPYVLMRENVPVVFGADRNTRARWRMASTPFRYSIGEFPPVRSNFFLVLLAPFFVIPLVPAADPHPGVFFSLEDFKLIVRLGYIFF